MMNDLDADRELRGAGERLRAAAAPGETATQFSYDRRTIPPKPRRSRWPAAISGGLVAAAVISLVAFGTIDRDERSITPADSRLSTPTQASEPDSDSTVAPSPTDAPAPSVAPLPPNSVVDRAAALIAIEAAQSAAPIVVASDDTIVLDSGDAWKLTVRFARTPDAIGMCIENVGSFMACQVLPTTADGPRILGYGGAPIPVVDVWSSTPFSAIEAELADGQTVTAEGVVTDVGTFAAFAFSAANPPVSLIARTELGDIDLGLADFVGPDADRSVAGATH